MAAEPCQKGSKPYYYSSHTAAGTAAVTAAGSPEWSLCRLLSLAHPCGMPEVSGSSR